MTTDKKDDIKITVRPHDPEFHKNLQMRKIQIIAEHFATDIICNSKMDYETISKKIEEAIKEGIQMDRSRIFQKLEEQKQLKTEMLYNDLLFRIISNDYEIDPKKPNTGGDLFPHMKLYEAPKAPEFVKTDLGKKLWQYYLANLARDEAWKKLYNESNLSSADCQRLIIDYFLKFDKWLTKS